MENNLKKKDVDSASRILSDNERVNLKNQFLNKRKRQMNN